MAVVVPFESPLASLDRAPHQARVGRHGAGQRHDPLAHRVGSDDDPGGGEPPDRVGRQAAAADADARRWRASPAIAATAMSSSPPRSSSCTPRRSCTTMSWTRATCGAARLAARLLWGNEASVLVGDFLLGQAFKMMVEVGSMRALEILSSAAAVIAEGEVMQLNAAKNTATTEDEYLTVIRSKTAELFAAACEVGPAIDGGSKDEQSACRSFGMNLGIAFQLVDDALDYGGKAAKLGKNVGDDFREGKITLPVVLSFRRGSESERTFWRRALEDGEFKRRRSRTGDCADGQASGAGGYRPARPPLRRHRQGCAGAVPGLANEGSAGRGGRVLHRRGRISPGSSARTHQSRCSLRSARAAAAAEWAVPNKPKQVAPDPDMRARRQLRSERSKPSTSAMTGCRTVAGASRSLPAAATSSINSANLRRGRAGRVSTFA